MKITLILSQMNLLRNLALIREESYEFTFICNILSTANYNLSFDEFFKVNQNNWMANEKH